VTELPLYNKCTLYVNPLVVNTAIFDMQLMFQERGVTREFPSGKGSFSPMLRQSSGLLVRRTDVRLRAIP
jgi:hypothetical protein